MCLELAGLASEADRLHLPTDSPRHVFMGTAKVQENKLVKNKIQLSKLEDLIGFIYVVIYLYFYLSIRIDIRYYFILVSGVPHSGQTLI